MFVRARYESYTNKAKNVHSLIMTNQSVVLNL